uniref:Reverse transcriptase domain-containing protein n=1 Tax=Cajanus cajan TaxID=3821 RepID=A0A151QV66_CAJCA|nr:hypothetical protein KK1_044912 [Cajanus cajan]
MTPPRADKTKACQFHRNRGHTTEECSAFRDRIEDLVKAGHLQNFIRTTDNRRNDYLPGRGEYRRDNRDRAPLRNRSRERNRAIKSVNAIGRASPIRIPPITFTDQDFQGIDPVQDDPMVISVEINNCIVKKTLVDQGSSADILYWKTFEQLGIPEQELTPYDEPLVGFSGERVDTRGMIDLYTYFGDDQRRQIKVHYVVVHANTSYNILLGRPSLNKLRAIVSTPHLAMKFPSEEGTVITVHADQKTARECYFANLKVKPTPKPRRDVNVIGDSGQQKLAEGLELDPRMDDEDRVEPIETTVLFQLGRNEDQVTFLSSQLSEVEAKDIKQVL